MKNDRSLAERVCQDMAAVSPETTVNLHPVEFGDPWDFEQVYETLFSFAHGYPFDVDAEDYLIHITTSTHAAQICLFLLTESRHLPGRLLQSSPDRQRGGPARSRSLISISPNMTASPSAFIKNRRLASVS